MKSIILLTSLLFSSVGFSDSSYRISGYLPGKTTKTWITVIDGQIACLDQQKGKTIPKHKNCVSGVKADQLPLIETSDTVFPGFMDLHNHIEFNALPLWTDAQGQFENRFEWREK